MHDGYIFTLGVCASAGGPAQAILDAMLAALPPVKRAAYLGDVLVSDGQPSLDDPLTAPMLADVSDAELLLIVAPLPGGRLPPRLDALARLLSSAPPPAAPRLAVLVTLGAEAGPALAAGLAAAGAELAGQLQLPADAEPEAAIPAAVELARAAYARARALRPDALPHA